MWSTLPVNTVVIANAERAAGLDVLQDQGVTYAVRLISTRHLVTALTLEILLAKFQNIAWMESSTKKTRFAALLHAELVVAPVAQLDLVGFLLVAVQEFPVRARHSPTQHAIFLGRCRMVFI